MSENLLKTDLTISNAFLLTDKRISNANESLIELYNESKFELPKRISVIELKRDTLRGLNCSIDEKYILCIQGEIYAVIVDLRPGSITYLKWQGIWLSSEEPTYFHIPKNCAHGFYCRSIVASIAYFHEEANQNDNIKLSPFDEKINIKWPKPYETYILIGDEKPYKTLDSVKNHEENETSHQNELKIENNLLENENRFLIYNNNDDISASLINTLKKSNVVFTIGNALLENRSDLMQEIDRLSPTRIILMPMRLNEKAFELLEVRKNLLKLYFVGYLNLIDIATELKIHCTLVTHEDSFKSDDKNEQSFKNNNQMIDTTFETTFQNLIETLLRLYPKLLNLKIIHPHPETSNKNQNKFLNEFKTHGINTPFFGTIDDLWPALIEMSSKGRIGTFSFNYYSTDSQNSNDKNQFEDSNIVNGFNHADKAGDIEKCSKSNVLPKLRYVPKNILLTGGAGFIGSHVAISLVRDHGYRVIVLDKLEYCSNMKNLQAIMKDKNFTFEQGDICDFDFVQQVMAKYDIDTVMHFAAQSHVDVSIRNSLDFTLVNVYGTHVLLENARIKNVRRFIHVSTDEVYGTTDEKPNINQSLDPTNPYACSKLAAECIILAYRKCFNLPVIISRGNNVYGPHQFLEKVIPKFIVRLLRDKKCCVHGDGSSERDFLYIDDVVSAFDYLLHFGKLEDEFYNIGALGGIKIIDLAKQLVRLMKKCEPGDEYKWIEFVQGRIIDDKRYKIDNSRLVELGWSQKIDIEEGLRRTIDWYTRNQNYWPNSNFALLSHPDEPEKKYESLLRKPTQED